MRRTTIAALLLAVTLAFAGCQSSPTAAQLQSLAAAETTYGTLRNAESNAIRAGKITVATDTAKINPLFVTARTALKDWKAFQLSGNLTGLTTAIASFNTAVDALKGYGISPAATTQPAK